MLPGSSPTTGLVISNIQQAFSDVTAAAAEALRGNVVRNISASLADEVAERAWSPVEPSGDCHVLSRLVTSCHVLSRLVTSYM